MIIKEKGTGVPVEGATVVLIETEEYDTSSASGLVKFTDVERLQRIKVIVTGYATQEFVTDQNKTQWVFYIESIYIEGDSMEVTAQRLVEKTSKIMLATAELTKAAGGAADPLEVVAALPGIALAEEGTLEVYMRGSNGNENIAWVNHAPIGYLYHFGGFPSTINPLLIKDVNVFLGGFPVQYGDALGGVLDVKLRTPNNDQNHYQFDISTFTSSFLIEGPVFESGGDSFFIAGRRSYMDLLYSADDLNKLIDDTDSDEILVVPNFYNFQALYHHRLKDGYLDSYVFTANDELAMNYGSTTKTDPHLAGELTEEFSYQTIGSTWQQRWNSQWNSITTLAYTQDKSAVSGGVDEQGQATFANIEKKTLRVHPALSWQPKVGSQISLGLLGRYTWTPLDLDAPRAYTGNDSDFTFTSQQKYRLKTELKTAEISPYIKHRYQWTNRLITQIGMRYTNIGVTGGFRTHQFSPRLTLEYQLTQDTLLMTTWGRYIQMPDSEQIVESYGNPSLLMTETEHRIIGVEHKINSLYSVKAEIYQKPMKNLVIALDENDPPNNYANRGTGKAHGLDLQNITFAKNVVAYRYGDDYENIDNPSAVNGFSLFPYAGIEMEF